MTIHPALARRAGAEAIGVAVLVAAVVGSGIMATNLTSDVGLQLVINALATVAALAVLIWSLGPVSGAHFNPCVSLVAAVRGQLSWRECAVYVTAQVLGGVAGAVLANVMFELAPITMSRHERAGIGPWIGEVVATAGLLALITALTRTESGRLAPVLVSAWIGSAYFFTASTSFANPAVTIARSFTDTFSGIAPASVPGFVTAQLVGAALGAALAAWFYPGGTAVSADPQPQDPGSAVGALDQA